jgi:hypothetical protein
MWTSSPGGEDDDDDDEEEEDEDVVITISVSGDALVWGTGWEQFC